jgi:hypothetical protein
LKINDAPAKFLVDTGATISLVSNEIFYVLDKSKRPEVRPLGKTIVTANGTNQLRILLEFPLSVVAFAVVLYILFSSDLFAHI